MKKKLRIVIGINSLTESQWPAYNSHLQLFYRLGRDNPNIDLCLVNPNRVGIDRMRNSAAAVTLNGGFDYLLFVDDDVLPPPDSLSRLIACKADIAAGDVIIRGYPFDHMCFTYRDKKKTILKSLQQYPKNANILPVDAVGFSLCLIHRDIIEKVKEPYFVTGLNHTEDVYFCLKARDAMPKCSIVVDTKLTCGHILWPEVISSINKKDYKIYFEKQNPEVLNAPAKREIKIKRVSSNISYESVVADEIKKECLLYEEAK